MIKENTMRTKLSLVKTTALALGAALLMIGVALLLLGVPGAAQAAPSATIQSMIDAAPEGGTVNIATGTYTESLTVNKTLTLTGVSSTTTIIQAVSGQRVITVTAGHNLRLVNLTVTGGHPSGSVGGGIFAGSNLLIINCRIANNSADYGGGVFQNDSTGRVDVIGSRIELNTTTAYHGGGLYVHGSAALTNTLVLSNSAGQHGGGLHVDGERTDLNGGLFSNNTAGINGGAVNLNNGLSIMGTQFISNTANDSGGGLVQWNAAYTVTVTNARFERNAARSKGGGAFIAGTSLISNSMFATNTVNSGSSDSYGGGVYAGGVSHILASTFVSNSARCTSCSFMLGGGMYTPQPATIQDSTFDRNDSWLGGGVYGSYAAITVTHSTFKNNIAGYGGAIDAYTIQATGSDFLSNRAVNNGGGLLAPSITLNGGQIVSNTANNDGGGVWAGNSLNAVSTLFSDNRSRRGGAVNANGYTNLTGTPFISNTANDSGGALFQSNPGYTVTMTNARFERNTAKSMGGGAFVSGTLTISSSNFVSNTTDSGSSGDALGGGLYASGASQIFTTSFAGNSVLCSGASCGDINGGGLYINGTSSTLAQVTFVDNQTVRLGGGIMSVGSDLTLNGGVFSGNLAGWGGGLYLDGGNLVLTNTLFSGNLAGWGGGMGQEYGTAIMTHVTFGGNRAVNIGGGLDNFVSNPTLVNCIFWGNSAPTGPQIGNEYGSTPAITYSDIQGTSVYTGVGNINTNPQFIAPIAAAAAPTTAGNYHLSISSPAINAGTNAGVPVDIDGELRDAAPDMGADELRTCWARLNNSPTDYGQVQAAVDASTQPADVVKVAGYCPGVQSRMGISQTVYISKSLTARGGYTTTNWTTSNPVANPTVLDAKQGGRVVFLTGGSSANIALENLIVRGGSINDVGGGIYDDNVTLTLSNTSVRDNVSNVWGGGVYVQAGKATVKEGQILSNTARVGGGMFAQTGSVLVVSRTQILSNTTSIGGGGVYANGGTLMVADSTVSGNSGSWWGGGIVNNGGALTLTNSTLSSNRAISSTYGGGAIDQTSEGSATTINHSTIVNNTADNVARSGIWLQGGTLTIQNSIVAHNSVTNNVQIDSGTFKSLGYNLTNSGAGTPFTATTDLINTHPLLGPLQNNGGSTSTYALLPGSPAIDRIPFGVSGCNISFTTDQRGQPRPGTFTRSCDMGAYEAQGIHYQIYLPVVIK
jgi:fibronectin-binding autotransporter adhesin